MLYVLIQFQNPVLLIFVIERNACKSNPCQNRAHCNRFGESYWCACYGNYVGPTCAGEFLVKCKQFTHEKCVMSTYFRSINHCYL